MNAIGTVALAAVWLIAFGCSHQPSAPTRQPDQLAESAYLKGDRDALIQLLKNPYLSKDPRAAYFVGAGLVSSERYQPQALELLKAAAAMGNSDAHFQLAQAFENGWGTEPDLLAALDHYRAARANEEGAYSALMIQSAEGAPFVNRAGEFERLRELAQAGDRDAQYRIGAFLDYGDGAPQDLGAAIHWYTKAAGQGHELANLNLGYFYCRSIGVPRDVAKAKQYLKASNRNAECKHME